MGAAPGGYLEVVTQSLGLSLVADKQVPTVLASESDRKMQHIGMYRGPQRSKSREAIQCRCYYYY